MFAYIEVEAIYEVSEQYKEIAMSDFWPYEGKEIVDLLCFEIPQIDHQKRWRRVLGVA